VTLWLYIALGKARPVRSRAARLGWTLVIGIKVFGSILSLLLGVIIATGNGFLWGIFGIVFISIGLIGSAKLGDWLTPAIMHRLKA
jgi:hypothetical protein